MESTPAAAAFPDEPTTDPDDPASVPDPGSRFRAKMMFFVAASFLVAFGVVLPHGTGSDAICEALLGMRWFWPGLILGLWGVILLDGLIGLFQATDGFARGFRRFLLVALIPPMRLAFSPARPNADVWFPRAGWLPVTKESAEVMEVVLAIPMLLITLAVLPVAVVEFFYQDLLVRNPDFGMLLHFITALIWVAFVVEFIMLLGVADKKLDFCRRHWVNIVIIVLPLVAFLRMLRLTRLVRLIRAGKMIRVYRVRGVYVRALRVAVLFNLVERILRRNPKSFLRNLEHRIREKRAELESLERQAEELRLEIAENNARLTEAETGAEAAVAPPKGN